MEVSQEELPAWVHEELKDSKNDGATARLIITSPFYWKAQVVRQLMRLVGWLLDWLVVLLIMTSMLLLLGYTSRPAPQTPIVVNNEKDDKEAALARCHDDCCRETVQTQKANRIYYCGLDGKLDNDNPPKPTSHPGITCANRCCVEATAEMPWGVLGVLYHCTADDHVDHSQEITYLNKQTSP